MKNTRLQLFFLRSAKKALEIYEGMTFNPPESSKVLDSVVQKFEEYCIGQTNETFKRYLFNSRSQKEDESIDHYVSAFRTLAKSCNFCQCLHESLIHDRIVFGVKEPALRKKLLQERQLTLEEAIDICKSGETTAQHLKDLATASDSNEVNALKLRDGKKPLKDPRDSKNAKKCKYCGGNHELKREKCPAERVITLPESVSSVDEGKNGSTQSRFLPVTLVNHCLQFN